MLRRRAPRFAALLASFISLGSASDARARPEVDLALVLAIDASYSVDRVEFRQQVLGLAAAFASPRVIAAIEALPRGAVTVAVTHWSKADTQVVSVPWTLVDGAAASLALAARLAASNRQTADGATSISGAILHAFNLFEQCPCAPERRTIDVSGDGRNNNGPALDPVRLEAEGRAITINGLAILNEVPTLHYYFESNVVAGAASFVEVASDYRDYARAIERKLLRELDAGLVNGPPLPVPDRQQAGLRYYSNSR